MGAMPEATEAATAAAAGGTGQRSSVFGNYSNEYDKYRPTYPEMSIASAVDIASRSTGDLNSLHVVDLACGTGKASMLYAKDKRVEKVLCVDHDKRMLEECKEVASNLSLRLEVHEGSAEKTGLDDSCVGLVAIHQAAHW